jgi:hypothetical protein
MGALVILYFLSTQFVSSGCLLYTRGAPHSRYTLAYPGLSSTKVTSFILEQSFKENFLFDLFLDELCFPVIISLPTYSFVCLFLVEPTAVQDHVIDQIKPDLIERRIRHVTCMTEIILSPASLLTYPGALAEWLRRLTRIFLASDIKSIRGQEFESLGRRHPFVLCLACVLLRVVLAVRVVGSWKQ